MKPTTLIEAVNICAEKFSSNYAIRDFNGDLTYSEFRESALGVSESLKSLGVKVGDHVGIDSDGRDLIILSYGVMCLGAVAVAIPRGLSTGERDELSNKCHLSVIITGDSDSQFSETLGKVNGFSLVSTYSLSRKKNFIPLDFLCKEEKQSYRLIRFTSGTTGSSKGVMFTEKTLMDRVNAVNEGLGINNDDVILWVLPMAYHFIVSIMLYLTYGASIVIPKNSTPQSIVDSIKKYKPTFLYATEHFYRLLLSNCKKGDLATVTKALATSARLSEGTNEKVFTKFGIPVMQAYGIIEGGLLSVNLCAGIDKRDSVGKVFDCYDLKIVDDSFNEVESGQVGSLVVKGPGFFDAYISEYRLSKDVCKDTEGYFSTGDVGVIDSEGYLFLEGRTKNIINCMGMKAFPEEIEGVLNSHPLIKESLVKAKKHPYLNEVPHATIVLSGGDKNTIGGELIKYCSNKLSAYKLPRSFEVVESLPKTGSGKIIRR